jgi:RNA polymerase sigma-70 factor (ECF subfamily)
MLNLLRARQGTTAQHHRENDSDTNHRWCVLIQRIARGDLDALSALYDESCGVVFGLILQIVEDRFVAEEILAAVYKRAQKESPKFLRQQQHAMDWLVTLARDLTITRRLQAGPIMPQTVPNVFEERRRFANLALAELPVEQRCILEMTYLGGLTVAEVASLLALSREYVASQIVFGMRKLRSLSANSVLPPSSVMKKGNDA